MRRPRGRTLVAAGCVALALAGAAMWLTLASDHEDTAATTLALALTAGLSFVGSGLIALWRRPENRTGYLLAAVGYLWFLGALTESNSDWVFTLGVALNSIAFGAFVQLLLAFPWGRLSRRRDVWLVLATYALVLAGNAAILLVDETPNPSCDGCRSTIAVTSSDAALTLVRVVVTVLALALIVALLAIVTTRFLRASRALKRLLGPVLVAGSLTMFVVALQVVVDTFSEPAARPLEYVFFATFAMVPLAFLAGVLRARLARSAVGELLLDLATGGGSLRDALARALHDPSLDIVYWLPRGERFVWHDGNPFVDEGGPRTARYVERNGQRVAALLHDPSLSDEPELVDAVAEAAALWLENERLQAELRAQIEYLETVVNTTPSLLMSLDTEGRIVSFNTACERASGYENGRLRNRFYWDVFIAPADRDGVRSRFEANLEHPPGTYENTFVNARDEEIVIAWSTAPLHDQQGNLRNVICGGLDVTERKRRELELQGERDFLDTMGDSIPSLLVLADREGQIVPDGVNRAFRETFGRTTDETARRSFLEFVHPEDDYSVRMAIAAAANGVTRRELESRWLPREGEPLLVFWTATPIAHPSDPNLVLITGEDVTFRRRQEEEVRASRARIVEAADTARRRLERNLHDGAQQRLVALSIALRLAQSRVADDPRGAGEILEVAREELAQALDELRELARGIHPAILTDRGLEAAVEALADRSPVPVEVVEIAGELPPAVAAAAYYVIAESLANVVKYAEASSVRVRVSEDEERVVIEVVDDGVGGADPGGGSGLRGLADRVEALEGALSTESPPGDGTVVRAEIPLRVAVPAPQG